MLPPSNGFLTRSITLNSLWDVADDAFFAKQNPCCPALHFEAMPRLSPAAWTSIYIVASLVLFAGFILAALATWKQSSFAMYCQVRFLVGPSALTGNKSL